MIQADALEELRALVGLNGGDAHLGGDVQDARGQGLVVVGDCRVRIHLQRALPAQVGDACLRKIGVHRPRAIADQCGQLVGVSGLAALQNYGHRRAALAADQMLLKCGHRQQRGNRHVILVHAAVGEDHHVCAAFVGRVAGAEHALHRVLQRGCAVVEQRDGLHLEARQIHLTNLLQLRAGEDRGLQLQHAAVLRRGLQQVAVVAHVDGAVRLELFAQRVDGRVGHLRKALLEVGGQRRMPAGQRRDGLVRAHGRDGFAALLRHGQQHVPHVLLSKSEGLAQLRTLRIRIFLRPLGGLLQIAQGVHALAEPISVGKHPGELLLDLLRPGKAPGAQVGHQQIARAQPPAAHDVLVLLVQHARLGGQDQAIVPRQRAAHGAQAVAIQ